MSAKLPMTAAMPLLLGATPGTPGVPPLDVPGSAQNPAALNAFTNMPIRRPLDPNGVDVYGEIPYMQRAYAKTDFGRGFGGKEEAMYGLMPQGDGYFSRTAVRLSPTRQNNMQIPSSAIAVVHTHPQSADPRPSPEDANMRFPNYVYSGNALYVTVPHTNKFFKYDIDKWNLPK